MPPVADDQPAASPGKVCTLRQERFLGLSAHGFHNVAYTEWGDAANARVLVCVHGLTRNGRDFDFLAANLQSHYRVVCPDVVGRGRSDWLTQKGGYGYAQYLADMNALIARLNADELHWVGTSMGGLIGMMLAAQPNTPIARLVLNDVGAFIPKAALERLAQYVGKAPVFASLQQAQQYFREVCAPFGALTDGQWHHLTEHSVRAAGGGNYVLRYDPAIGDAFSSPLQDIHLWPVWAKVQCPTLIIRGAESDLLLPETLVQMQASRANVGSLEVPGTGHAPALMSEAQIAHVREFLLHDD